MNSANEIQDDRYMEFLTHLAKNKMAYLLQAFDGMYAMFGDNNGVEYVPVWHEKAYAAEHINDDWKSYTVTGMPLFEFMSWLKELADDEIMIAIWPQPEMNAMGITPLELKSNLENLLKVQ